MQEIDAGGGRSVRSWASLVDPKTIEQAKLLARHPNITQPVALMPDAHVGIGATVGSVALCEGGIIPSIVGVDIGCGVTLLKLPLTIPDPMLEDDRKRVLGPAYTPPKVSIDGVKALSGLMRKIVPSGMGVGFTEEQPEHALIPAPRSERVEALWSKAREQFGTLGAGNHFAELSATVLAEGAFGRSDRRTSWLRILVHSGSRGIGNQLAQYYIDEAAKQYPVSGMPRELACIPEGSQLFNDYITDMLWAQDYAYMSRLMMATRITKAFYEIIGHNPGNREDSSMISCHHNYAVRYTDKASGVTDWLSRKGAIDASKNVRGVIPGSMGTATYVVEGKGEELSYNSAPHGAGRLFSRGEARRTLGVESFKAMMGTRVWQDRDADRLVDEAPDAYKDITQVMADAVDLVTVREELRSLMNYKGV